MLCLPLAPSHPIATSVACSLQTNSQTPPTSLLLNGRCFFRSVVIGFKCDLQAAQCNPVTRVIIDTMKSLLETALADNLRTMVISHMCEKVCVEPDAAVLNMPERLKFSRVLEVQSRAEVFGRTIHVSVAPGNHIVEYVPKDVCHKVPLLVKSLPHQEMS